MAFRVIGVGDNVVDKYVNLGVLFPGGQALNFAVYAKMLGADSAYLGAFGNDRNAKVVRQAAEKEGIRLDGCVTREGENGYACVEIREGDRVFLYSNKGGAAGTQPMVLSQQDIDYIKTHELIFTDDNCRMLDELPKLKATGIPVVFDFSVRWTPENLARFAPYADYAVLSCADFTMAQMEEGIRGAHENGCRCVIATRASEGSWFSGEGRKIVHHDANMVCAKDSLGAGDAFVTAFVLDFVAWEKQNPGATDEAWEAAAHKAMEGGANFSAKICMIDGAFGYSTPIEE